jgi:excisionase family DNA binding protein
MPAANTEDKSIRLPLTLNEYAALVGVSRTTVRKWIARGQVKFERRGGGAHRAASVLIYQTARPKRLMPGSLTPEQRKAWKKK